MLHDANSLYKVLLWSIPDSRLILISVLLICSKNKTNPLIENQASMESSLKRNLEHGVRYFICSAIFDFKFNPWDYMHKMNIWAQLSGVSKQGQLNP